MAQEESTTVARAAAVLWELARSPRGVAVSDLADRVGTQRAPLYRILRALERARFVRRDDHRLYHVSFGLIPLAEAAAEPLDVIARPRLVELADRTGCTAMLLMTGAGDSIVTALCVTPSTPGMYVTTPPGFVHPEGRIASRVAIEAARPPRDDDPDDVRRARADGFAASGTEGSGARFGIAAPLDLGALGEEGCILLVTLGEAHPSDLAAPLAETAAALTRALGRD